MKRGLYVPPRHFGSNGGFFGRKRDTEQDDDDTLVSSIAVHLITFPNVLFATRTLPRTKLIFSVAWIDLECFSGEIASVEGTRNCTNLPLMVTSNRQSYLLSMGLRELVVFCHILHVFSANTQSTDLLDWIFMYGYLAYPILSAIKDDSLVPFWTIWRLGWFLCLKLSQSGIKLLHPLCTVLVWPGGCGLGIHVLLRQKSHPSGSG